MKTYITKIPSALLAIALVLGCQPDKQTKLIELKKKQQAINAEVAKLESEIAADTSIVKNEDNGIKVVTATITKRTFTHYIEIQGKLDGEENVQVYPKGQGGVVTRIYAKVGQQIAKGQLLAQLDDVAYVKSLEQTRAQYDLAKEMYERQSRLWEQKIGSEVQYLQAKTQKEALEKAVAALEEQVDFMKIKSPIAGSLEDFPIKVGQAVSPVYPVATVINFNSMKVVADIAEAYGPNINVGDSVAIYFPDLKSEVASTVASASKYINPVNRSFKIETRLSGSDKQFRANMIAVVKIADYKNPSTVSIPVNYIQTDSKGDFVFAAVEENGKWMARKKYIQQGRSYNGTTEIISGLTEGDKVISVGHLSLSDGTPIQL
ncbi:MAG: efflux RND transporter periplasmic adaptor subunit [Breznakibacter sp.]